MRGSYLFIFFSTLLLTVGSTAISCDVGEQMVEGTPAVLLIEKNMLTDEELACFSADGGSYLLNVESDFSWCDRVSPEKNADF